MKELELYEVLIPVKETWIFHILASSKKNAIERIYNHEGEQVCSDGGWPTIKTKGTSYPTNNPIAFKIKEVTQRTERRNK